MEIDPDVIERAVAGDREAFGHIYTVTHRQLRTFVDKRVHLHTTLPVSHVDDLVCDIYVKALRSIDRFEPRKSIMAWLYTIAKNTIIDRQAHGFYHFEMSVFDAVKPGAEEMNHPYDREDEHSLRSLELVENAYIRKLISEALADLTDAQRLVIIHRFLLNYSVDETVEVLKSHLKNLNASQVKGLTYRAIGALRKTIIEEQVR